MTSYNSQWLLACKKKKKKKSWIYSPIPTTLSIFTPKVHVISQPYTRYTGQLVVNLHETGLNTNLCFVIIPRRNGARLPINTHVGFVYNRNWYPQLYLILIFASLCVWRLKPGTYWVPEMSCGVREVFLSCLRDISVPEYRKSGFPALPEAELAEGRRWGCRLVSALALAVISLGCRKVRARPCYLYSLYSIPYLVCLENSPTHTAPTGPSSTSNIACRCLFQENSRGKLQGGTSQWP